MTYSRENANLEQFKKAMKSSTDKLTVCYFLPNPECPKYGDYYTVATSVGDTSYILHTQKNELRRFKNMAALTSALGITSNAKTINLSII